MSSNNDNILLNGLISLIAIAVMGLMLLGTLFAIHWGLTLIVPTTVADTVTGGVAFTIFVGLMVGIVGYIADQK